MKERVKKGGTGERVMGERGRRGEGERKMENWKRRKNVYQGRITKQTPRNWEGTRQNKLT